jgi:hypothetical protein
MGGKLFNMKDIARIIESISTEEAEARPIQTRYVKDYMLTVLWPAVIKEFYPQAYTLRDALSEAHLLDFFNYVWSNQWIMVMFDLLRTVGIDDDVLEAIRQQLLDTLESIFKEILK